MRQVATLLLIFSLAAQTGTPPAVPDPAPLVFADEPLRVPVACTEDDIQSLGMTCSFDSPCPVFLELSGLEVSTGRMILAGNLHTESATLSSVVLASEDGGKTWTENHPRIRQAALDQMQFIDLATGWISGQLITSLPRDPFFLLTADGGKTWKQRAVFSESRPGSIEKFLFTTANQGKVLVNREQSTEGGRFALLESMTGGDSWSIQQITEKQPNVKFDRPPSSAWRLVTHAASKTYRIERREAQKWTSVVSFLVQPGECKAAATELKEPPPTETETAPVKPAPTKDDAVAEFQIGTPKPKPVKKKK